MFALNFSFILISMALALALLHPALALRVKSLALALLHPALTLALALMLLALLTSLLQASTISTFLPGLAYTPGPPLKEGVILISYVTVQIIINLINLRQCY
jgi:hypothetical protein